MRKPRIIAVDPGWRAEEGAVAYYDGAGWDTIHLKGDINKKMSSLLAFMRLPSHEADHYFIEDQFLGKNVRSMKQLILARGHLEAIIRRFGEPVPMNPRSWQSMVGVPAATKTPEVKVYAEGYVSMRLGVTLSTQHEYDAMAMALVGYDVISVYGEWKNRKASNRRYLKRGP